MTLLTAFACTAGNSISNRTPKSTEVDDLAAAQKVLSLTLPSARQRNEDRSQEDAASDVELPSSAPPQPPPRARWRANAPSPATNLDTTPSNDDSDDDDLNPDHRPEPFAAPKLAGGAAISLAPSNMLAGSSATSPERERILRARAALLASHSTSELSAKAIAERQSVLELTDGSIKAQKGILVELSGLEPDAGVAAMLKRNAVALDWEQRRLRAMMDHTDSDSLAATMPTAGAPPASPGFALLRTPGASEGGNVAAARRLASTLFDGGKKLDVQIERLSRAATAATEELPSDVRALLNRRLDALQREREFLARRLAVHAQKMEANFHSARRSQSAWLENQVTMTELSDVSPTSAASSSGPVSRLYARLKPSRSEPTEDSPLNDTC